MVVSDHPPIGGQGHLVPSPLGSFSESVSQAEGLCLLSTTQSTNLPKEIYSPTSSSV